MRKYVYYILMFVSSLSYAQGLDRKAEYVPPSPNAAEISRYGLVPINQYTGIPDINVPLYELNFDGKRIPVALRYHAGGIRTNQESSWIGLGWSLSSNAVITRQINYKSDIGQGKLPNDHHATGAYSYIDPVPGNIYGNAGYINTLESFEGITTYDQMDTQPDIFTASLLGQIVKFQLTQSISNDIIQTKILNDSKAIVTFNVATQSFTILDDNGYTYYFNQKEYSSTTSHNSSSLPSDIMPFDGGVSENYHYGLDRHIITAWFVDKITSPNGKILEFNYLGEDDNNSQTDEELYLSLSPTYVHESKPFAFCQSGNTYNSVSELKSYQRSVLESKYLKEIVDTSTGQRIVFHVDNRNDILVFDPVRDGGVVGTNGFYNLFDNIKPPKRLTQIDVFSPKGKKVKKISLYQDYFNGDDASNVNADNYLRLKLNQVIVDNSSYTFEYEQSDNLPAKNTSGKDFWGFYNGQNNQKRFPMQWLDDTFPVGNCNAQALPVAGFAVIGGNLGSSFNYGKIGVLNKINYPTGGSTFFEYEANTITISEVSGNQNYSKYTNMYLEHNNLEISAGYPRAFNSNKTYRVGGLRVRSVANLDNNEIDILRKDYRYEGFDGSSIPMSSGKLMNELFYYYPTEAYDSSSGYLSTNLVSSSSNKVYGNNSAQGNHVGYSFVEETIVDTQKAGENNGRIVTKYRNKANQALQTTFYGNGQVNLDAPSVIFEEGNGKLEEQYIYDNTGSTTPKREILNTYTYNNDIESFALKTYFSNMRMTIIGGGGSDGYGTTGQYDILYDYFLYPVKRTYSLLTNSTVTDNYSDGSSNQVITDFTYNEKPQLTSKSITSSKGHVSKKNFYYPYDTDFGLNSYPKMPDLFGQNRIGSPVYVRNFYNENLVGHQLASYNTFSNGLLKTSSISFQKQDAPLNQIEKRVEFLEYDQYAKPLKISKDSGPVTEMIWGYENMYPVAQILNAPINGAAINTIVNNDVLLDPTSSKTDIKIELDKIRNHPDYQKSLISTYAFDPMVGLVENTDQRGYKSSYSYDDRERLIEVRDDENRLIGDYKYNLTYEDTDCLENCTQELTLTTNKYVVNSNENFTVSYNVSGSNYTINRWEIRYGDDSFESGSGSPSNFTHSYTGNSGLKPIRLFLYDANNNFITANVNVRLN